MELSEWVRFAPCLIQFLSPVIGPQILQQESGSSFGKFQHSFSVAPISVAIIEQAMVYLGDIYQGLGKEEDALQTYSDALNHPGAAKGAAERLVAILQKQNRHEEAAFLFKRYLKGCC